jgi:hypothetical protein
MSDTPRTAVLDTNVLLLLLAGETDASLLRTFKRVDSFTEMDLELLTTTLQPFREIITTPHVLAEVSNFVDQAPLYKRADLISALQRFVEENAEHYEYARRLVVRAEFRWLALADTGLVSLSSEAVIVTTDYQLANQIALDGGHVINFNHLRGQQLLTR